MIKASYGGFCDTDAGWKQVWKDDFSTLNTESWTITLGENGGQGREAYLTADNVYVQQGNLVLRSQKQTVNNFNYTSGAVHSMNKKFWPDSPALRVCVSAKLPGGDAKTGKGIWPAHWLMPNDKSCWPDHGEVDIMEMINGDGNVHGSFHWDAGYPGKPCTNSNTQVTDSIQVADWATTYHEYATEFTSEYVAYVVDSKIYVNFTSASHNPAPQFPSNPMYIILNTAVGGPWPGPPNDQTVFPTYHYIDYVTVAIRT